jgi:electron transport complex protein RnfE
MGVGFTLALFVLGAVREVLGAGSLFGVSLFGSGYQPVLLMILPPGAFISLGFLLAGMNLIEARRR